MASSCSSHDAPSVAACMRPRGFSRPAARAVVDPQERIREILADKSTLLRVPLLAREFWVAKDARTHCVFCERRFRTFSRKLHCRGCGEVVCSSCNRKRDVQADLTSADVLPVRLCLDCIDRALTPPEEIDEDEDNEASFTNSGRVTLSACSSHMKFADGLLDSVRSGGAATTTTDSFVNLELSQYEGDSEGGDTDRDSAYGYESDDSSVDDGNGVDADGGGRARQHSYALSISGSTTSTASSSGSGSGLRALGFVPEDASLGEPMGEPPLAMGDLEDARRAALLKQLNVASLERQREFDAICELVSRALDCRVAAVGFMGETAQWYKSKIGISQAQLPREVAFCARALPSTSATVVLDASRDDRFRTNPLVTGAARIRFYASMPICDAETQLVLGSVFVMDREPKAQLPPRAMEVLAYASAAAERLLQMGQREQHRRRSRQQRMRRVFSEPTLGDAWGGGEEENDDDEDGRAKVDVAPRFAQSAGVRGRPLWTTEPPHYRSSAGITLFDADALAKSTRCETESAKVLGRLRPRGRGHDESPRPSGLCEDILLQIESTQQLLSSFGPRKKPPRQSGGVQLLPLEVEV